MRWNCFRTTEANICARSARNCRHDSGAILPHSRDVRPDQDYRVISHLDTEHSMKLQGPVQAYMLWEMRARKNQIWSYLLDGSLGNIWRYKITNITLADMKNRRTRERDRGPESLSLPCTILTKNSLKVGWNQVKTSSHWRSICCSTLARTNYQ